MPFFDKILGIFAKGGDIDAAVAKKDFGKLVRFLAKGKNEREKMLAAEALGDMGDERAFGPLAAALRDDAFYMNSYAAEALAKVGGAKAVPYLLAALERHDSHDSVTRSALKLLGEKAFPALVAQYRRSDYRIDLANILVGLDCAAAVPDIKKDLDRKAFAGYDTRFIENFVDRHKDLWSQAEKVRCLVCKKEAAIGEMKGSGDTWFCPDPCWGQRGKLLSKGIGKDCPLYLDGFCRAGDGQAFCSLAVGHYLNDCHVYAIHK